MYLQSNNSLPIASVFMNRRVFYQYHHTDYLKPQPHSPDGVSRGSLNTPSSVARMPGSVGFIFWPSRFWLFFAKFGFYGPKLLWRDQVRPHPNKKIGTGFTPPLPPPSEPGLQATLDGVFRHFRVSTSVLSPEDYYTIDWAREKLLVLVIYGVLFEWARNQAESSVPDSGDDLMKWCKLICKFWVMHKNPSFANTLSSHISNDLWIISTDKTCPFQWAFSSTKSCGL